MTGEDFREIALSLQGAAEGAHMKHPDFRANGRIFASLQSDEKAGVVKLSPEEQQEFIRADPDVFVPASGAWGRQGWTMVHLGGAQHRVVRAALMLAWQSVSQLPVSRKRPKRR
jgi:hypothetical protein